MSLILQVRKTETRQTPAGNPETTCFLRARAGAGIFVSRGLDVSTVSLLELLCRDVITNQEICLIFFSFFLMYAFTTLLLSSYYCSRERTKKIKTINPALKAVFVATLIKPVSHLHMPLGGGSWFSQQHCNPCLVRADVETERCSELIRTVC